MINNDSIKNQRKQNLSCVFGAHSESSTWVGHRSGSNEDTPSVLPQTFTSTSS